MYSLRFRFLISLSLIAAVALLALWLIASLFIQPRLIEREDVYVGREMDRLDRTLELEMNILGSDTRDWANWDASYDFARGLRDSYIAENFSREMFEDKRHLLMLYMNLEGEILYAAGLDAQRDNYSGCRVLEGACAWMMPWAEVIVPQVLDQSLELEQWLISTPQPAMVATSPLLPTEREAPPVGWLAIVRLMDHQWLQSMEESTGRTVDIEPITNSGLVPTLPPILRLDDQRLLATRWLESAPEGSRLRLQALLPRRDHIANAATFNFALVWTGLLLLALLIVILLLLEMIIIGPVRHLARFTREQLDSSDDTSRTLPTALVARRDEIGSLAREFQHLLVHHRSRTDTLERQSLHDHLTGLFNRRYLDDFLARTLQIAQQEGLRTGLLIIDIDYFKAYNDHYGHVEGDRCLAAVARALEQTINGYGVMARAGGEEFIAVLPASPEEQTRRLAEALCRNVAALKLTHAHSEIADHVTISVGLASCLPETSLMPSDLLRQADSSLYGAKQAGRNRVGEMPLDPTAPADDDGHPGQDGKRAHGRGDD